MNGLYTIFPTPLNTTSTTVLDATGEYASTIFQAIPGKTITKIAARCTSSSSGVVDISLETVSSLLPSGTLVAANTQLTSQNVSSSTNYEWTLTASYAVPENDVTIISAVIRWNSGTATFLSRLGEEQAMPRAVVNTGTPSTVYALPSIGVGYSDGTWHSGIATLSVTPPSATYSTSSTYDEYGNYFICPNNIKVIGIMSGQERITASAGALFRIYDKDLNVLTDDDELSFYEEDSFTSPTASSAKPMIFFKSPIYLSGGKEYYITRTALNTNNIYRYILTFPSTEIKQALTYDPILCYRDGGTGSFSTSSLEADVLSPLCCCGFSSYARVG
jgi:hypothetical protein